MKNLNLFNLKSIVRSKARWLLTLITLLSLGVGNVWAGAGYNNESHVYLKVNGETKYYEVTDWDWSTGATLPGTWGGVLSEQTFNSVLNIQLVGGAVGGWTNTDGTPTTLSGTLYYKVTNSSSTPTTWDNFGSIATNSVYKQNSNNCFYYKNNGSTNITPTIPGTYYLHIKITDGASNNRTSSVAFTVPPFTVAGSSAVLGSNWSVTDTGNDMTFSSGTSYTLTKSNVTLSTGTTYECKVVLNHNWDAGSYPGSNKTFTVTANGHYNVTFTFNASTKAVDVSTTRLYAVSYDGNSNTSGSVPATTYHANGATVTVASNSGSLARTGYDFGGWNINTSGTGTNYTAGSGTFTMGSSDKTLYAKWTAQNYSITYKDQGNVTFSGTHGSGYPTSHTYGSATALVNPTKTGYLFGGWYTNSSCTSPAVTSLGATAYTAGITLYAKWTAITVSATVSPSSGVEGANNLTFSISSNVPTNSGYYVAVYNFGESDYSGGYLDGDKPFDANPKSYTCTTPSLSTGTVYTRVIVMKDAVVHATSDKIAFTVASASDPTWSMYNNETKLDDFTNNGDGSHSLVVTIPAGGYALTHYKNDQAFDGAPGAEPLTTERTLVNNNGRIAWQDGAGTFRITIHKDGSDWKISAVRVYSVTYNANGATSGSVPTDENYYTSGSTVTVKTNSGSLAKTGYTFGGWNTNTSGTGDNYTAGTGTFSITADKTLYAKWTETMHTVTVRRNNATLGTVNTTSVSAGAATASTTITATPVSGATFTGWTIPSGVTLASGTTSSTSITIYATEDSKTITANFSETTYTVNVALAVAAQSNGTTSPNGNTQVGAITPVQITAPTPKTGYLSTGRWTTTGGVTVANPTANPTTITATSNGTVRWTFDEDLTTVWYLTGSFNGWSSTTNKFTKKTGESTGKVAYTTVDLAANTTCTFGVSDGTTYYSNNNTTDAPTYYIKGTVEDWTFESNLGYGINCGMVSTLAGTYTFKIDFSGANPKVSVYYPEIYAISGSFNSWSESNNLSFTGNDGTYEVTINGSSTKYEFKVLDNAVWYGHANKTFTATESNVTLASGGNNIKLKADVYPNGTYTFTYNKSTKKLGVTYPTSHVVNFGKRTGGNSVTAKINNTTAINTGTKIASGTSVTFSQTAATGYTFEGWYDAASGGTKLSSSATYTTTISTATTVYANYTEQLYTIEVQNSNGTAGTITVPAAPATNVSAGIVTHPTITAVANPGYHFTGWTKTVNGSNVTIADDFAASTTISNATGTATIQANWAANTYTVKFDKHQGDYYGEVSGTMENQSFTYDAAATALRTNTYDLTGYTFLGWSTYSDQNEKTFNASAHPYDYLDGASVSNLTATNGGTVTMYAIWRPNQYTITYNANGGTCGTISQTAYFYNAVSGDFPIAAKTNKHFNGWYTAASDGTQLATNSAWLENVTNYLTSYKWIKPANTEVFAQYSDPAMGTTTFSATAVAKGGTVTVYPHVTIAPDDAYSIWLELQNMDGTPVATQPAAFSTAVDEVASVLQTTFTAPTIGSTYKVVATMRAGSSSSGTVLATAAAASFEVEMDHVITLVYVDNSRNIIAPSTTTTALQSDSTVITAPDILGYSFSHWKSSNLTDLWFTTTDSDHDADNATAYIYAKANATDTAFYNEKEMIYFYNNLGWEDVWVYFYSAGGWWDNAKGSGSSGANCLGHGHMTQIAGTNVWYLDYTNTANTGGANVSSSGVVCFNKHEQNGYDPFYGTECAYRSDFCSNATMPMYVPYTTASNVISDRSTNYYNYGYWMHYPNQTGYQLRVYNQASTDGAVEQTSKSTDFVASASIAMPFTATMSLEAGQTLYFKVSTQDGKWYHNANTMTAANHEQWEILNESGNNTGITATAAGDYTFTLYYDIYSTEAATAEPKFRISVEYPLSEGDYRLMYSDNAHSAKVPSHIIHNVAGNVDTVNFYVRKGQSPVIRVDKCANIAANGTITWTEGVTTNLVSGKTFDKDTVYNIIVTVNEDATNVNYTAHEYYSGNYYIRTDAVSNGWDHYTVDADHQMVYSEYSMSLATNPYTYYKAKWATHGTNIKAVVATDYSPAVSDTLKGDDVISGLEPTVPGTGDAGANIRFSYNASTNTLYRAYLAGAQGGAFDPDFLKLTENPDNDKMKDDGGSDIDYITFTDDGNWLYSATITASPGLQGALTAKYNGHTQTFYTTGTTILGGEGSEAQSILLRYDFKTGRLIRAWLPNGDITKNIDLQADMILIRHGQSDEPNGGVTQLTFTNGSVLNVETAYGVIELRYNDMVGQMNSWSDATSYRYCYYYISFPFDVKISTIIGPGHYDYEWDIQQYRGDLRASEGWFLADGRTTFWETMPQSGTLHKNVGYLLRLSRADFNVKVAGGVWDNKSAGSKLYYYFPSTSALGTITDHTNVPLYVPEHVCEIDRIFTQDIEADKTTEALGGRNHKYTDSNWNMIGSPLFENQTGSVVSTTALYDSTAINYLYTWNYSSNSLSVTRAHNFTFNSMYGYMVQFAGQINFTGASIGAAVAARRLESEKNYTIEMQLFKGDTQAANTYIELKDDGHDNYMLNEDLYLMASGKTDLYTYAGGYDVAANILSVNNHVIPVGVKTNAAGEYTFSMPSDFDGTVVLVDNFDGSRTDLSLGDYSVALPKGTIEDRFTLEINIERSSATDIEGIEGGTIKDGKAHKFVRDGIMYILRDGVIYDAMGKRVK